jgi:hypothetical protein
MRRDKGVATKLQALGWKESGQFEQLKESQCGLREESKGCLV